MQNATITGASAAPPISFWTALATVLATSTTSKRPPATMAASWSSVSTRVALWPSRLSSVSTGTFSSAAGSPEAALS